MAMDEIAWGLALLAVAGLLAWRLLRRRRGPARPAPDGGQRDGATGSTGRDADAVDTEAVTTRPQSTQADSDSQGFSPTLVLPDAAAQADAEARAAQRAADAEAALAAEQAAAEAAAALRSAALAAEQAAARRTAERLAAEAAARAAAEAAARELAEREAAARELAEREAAAHAAAAREAEERLAAAHAAAAREAAAREAAARQASAQEAALRAAVAAPPAPPRTPAQTLVLLADDSKVVRVKTSRLLAKHAFRVALAEDGAQALQMLDDELPQVLITDVEMPGIDGVELTRRVRADPRTAAVPVIMITSADERLRSTADAAGVTLLLGKPYGDDELVAHVARLAGVALAGPDAAPA